MLGMNVTITSVVDRITIDGNCLNHGITLEDLAAKIQSLTHNIRIHSGDYPKIEVFFQSNDLDNLYEGYEQHVMEMIKEHTHRVILFSNDMTLDAKFEDPS